MLAKVDVGGVKRNINMGLMEDGEVQVGDWVLIHVGFAMSKIDENEARETMQALQIMGDVFTDELKMLHESQIE